MAGGKRTVISWNDPGALPEEGAVVLKNAQVGKHDGQVQLTIREGVTTVEAIQAGVGFTEAELLEEQQRALDDARKEAASDGGTTRDEGGYARPMAPPPKDAVGTRAAAQRLVSTLRNHRQNDFTEAEALSQAQQIEGIDSFEEAKTALDKAVEEMGAIARADGEFEVL